MDNINRRYNDAWGGYIETRVSRGWQPYLLTFMFEPLPGGAAAKMAQMTRYLEAAYAVFVTRVVRKRGPQRRGVSPLSGCARPTSLSTSGRNRACATFSSTTGCTSMQSC